jgi:hypothetical protein
MNNVIVGLTVAVLGFGFASAHGSTHRIAWACPVLGAWTIVALWMLNNAAITLGSLLSNVLAGSVVLLCGLAVLRTGRVPDTVTHHTMITRTQRMRRGGRR